MFIKFYLEYGLLLRMGSYVYLLPQHSFNIYFLDGVSLDSLVSLHWSASSSCINLNVDFCCRELLGCTLPNDNIKKLWRNKCFKAQPWAWGHCATSTMGQVQSGVKWSRVHGSYEGKPPLLIWTKFTSWTKASLTQLSQFLLLCIVQKKSLNKDHTIDKTYSR